MHGCAVRKTRTKESSRARVRGMRVWKTLLLCMIVCGLSGQCCALRAPFGMRSAQITHPIMLGATFLSSAAGIPAVPLYFEQRVDHFSASNATFLQRYYLNDTSASATPVILVIMGGEGAIPPSTGFFYPFVVDVLAPKFEALVIEPEHRFYGASLPFGSATSYEIEHLRLLTPMQALADTAELIRSVQRGRNCSLVRARLATAPSSPSAAPTLAGCQP